VSEVILPHSDATIETTTENKCGFCANSKCCTYITQQLDTPRSKSDFDTLLWQVSHQHISVYQDSDGWFLLIDTPCSHLEADGGCGIYSTRPEICREHSNDYCEYDAPASEAFKRYFRNHSELLAYCRKRFKKWGQ
jgi:Fe-S-cluster containining protein